MVAEHVAEEERDAARGIRAERIGADTDRRLPGVVESESFGLYAETGGVARRRRKASGFVLHRGEHLAFAVAPRRQHGRVERQIDERHARQLRVAFERVDVVAVVFVRAEHSAAVRRRTGPG